ncbi:hypothetical protein EJ08DRAFT_648673 [Tothia fuscella]|uniref:Uncharacterized protein n=1 Tax=Tothia fuscella TaxID=1048955 RepID=A0A9P4U096_9PEZI|nr:hypothetical protein EJ08DRAFT_648673 [Tothia fuscella]
MDQSSRAPIDPVVRLPEQDAANDGMPIRNVDFSERTDNSALYPSSSNVEYFPENFTPYSNANDTFSTTEKDNEKSSHEKLISNDTNPPTYGIVNSKPSFPAKLIISNNNPPASKSTDSKPQTQSSLSIKIVDKEGCCHHVKLALATAGSVSRIVDLEKGGECEDRLSRAEWRELMQLLFMVFLLLLVVLISCVTIGLSVDAREFGESGALAGRSAGEDYRQYYDWTVVEPLRRLMTRR